MSEYPQDRLYAGELHMWGNGEWFERDRKLQKPGDRVRVGFTAFFTGQLPDRGLRVQLPEVGSYVEFGDYFGRVSWRQEGDADSEEDWEEGDADSGEEGDADFYEEGSDFCAPVEAKVVAVNTELVNTPELLIRDPYGEGWLFEMEIHDHNPRSDFNWEADGYAEFIAQEQEND
ncbi:glycine cleavage system protein H [Streptosporangium sp. NPDC003464]